MKFLSTTVVTAGAEKKGWTTFCSDICGKDACSVNHSYFGDVWKQICKKKKKPSIPFMLIITPSKKSSIWVNVSTLGKCTCSLRALWEYVCVCNTLCVFPSDSPSSLLHLWSCHSRPGSLPGGEQETQNRCHLLSGRWRTDRRNHGDVSLGKGEKMERLRQQNVEN